MGLPLKAPQPLAHTAWSNATKRGVPYILSLPLRVSDRFDEGSGLSTSVPLLLTVVL